ncbi:MULTISPECIES: putative glycolipid-binding domain-containing protein [unclassified Bradyrhizobium]|uniref:putative glycolipid-binding domain-containing protein n=1 Tax=unclassified Bradyrhizobium TaxID=2631580 RepID=UPI00291700C9|nr:MULTISPECIES: putative glycolipid-binding domain-containing protein [unclassified Bradyrhizobium]
MALTPVHPASCVSEGICGPTRLGDVSPSSSIGPEIDPLARANPLALQRTYRGSCRRGREFCYYDEGLVGSGFDEMAFESVVWEWPERRGLEHLRLWTLPEGIKADDLVVADTERQVIRFRYSISLHPDWRLSRCGVFDGTSHRAVRLAVDQHGQWSVDQQPRPDLEGCAAFDILDSPLPKSAILRRLDLRDGASEEIKVAQIDNRQMRVMPVVQEWRRLTASREHGRRYGCLMKNERLEIDFDERVLVQLCQYRWRLASAGHLTGTD